MFRRGRLDLPGPLVGVEAFVGLFEQLVEGGAARWAGGEPDAGPDPHVWSPRLIGRSSSAVIRSASTRGTDGR